ncbi:uncharacterized protein EV420DRAFT_1569637 [Desarmillaria tabescens]|uniref:F-box domain-containing protein n=1 Tax=Armillaria tabescens TaxID=1929756 RepID=A0AA39JQ83_ARMTA|nr:uncharacterized protein EV420DRAFT_1569637 [Desarmillaria tabescens]KAK0446502.1 hypothetical protein EV420DRAFT_1569637 [Desarmillaria tabescens]
MLPPGLSEAVSKYLCVDDLKNFRACCRRMNDASAAVFFSCLVVDVVCRGYRTTVEMLQALANAHPAATHVRHLKILSLSDQCIAYARDYTDFDLKPRQECPTRISPSETTMFKRALQTALPIAMAALSGLNSLIIYTCGQDPQGAVNVLVNSAVTYRSLEKFSHLTSAEQANLRPFITQNVTNLRKLSLSYWIDRRSPLVPILVQIISRNLALSCLELDNGANDKSNESFNALLSGIPDDVSLPLSRLVLGSFDVTIDDRLMEHFRSLTELRLGEATSFVVNDRKHIPDIWTTLQAKSICLKSISIPSSHVSFSLDGLELQHFERPIQNHTASQYEIALAEELFSSIIPKHAASLNTLMIFSHLERPWQFSVARSAVLAQCRSLIRLGVGMERGVLQQRNRRVRSFFGAEISVPILEPAANTHNIVRDMESLVRMAETLPSLEGLWISMESITLESMGVDDEDEIEYNDDFPDHYAALHYGLDRHVFVAQDGAWTRKANGPSRGNDTKYSDSAALYWGSTEGMLSRGHSW